MFWSLQTLYECGAQAHTNKTSIPIKKKNTTKTKVLKDVGTKDCGNMEARKLGQFVPLYPLIPCLRSLPSVD